MLIGFVLSNKRRNLMVSLEKIPRNCREQLTNSHHFFPWFSTPELVQLKQEKWWSLASWDLIKHIAIITKNLNMWRSQHLLSHFIWKINKNYLKQKLITINIQQLILSASNLLLQIVPVLFLSLRVKWSSGDCMDWYRILITSTSGLRSRNCAACTNICCTLQFTSLEASSLRHWQPGPVETKYKFCAVYCIRNQHSNHTNDFGHLFWPYKLPFYGMTKASIVLRL